MFDASAKLAGLIARGEYDPGDRDFLQRYPLPVSEGHFDRRVRDRAPHTAAVFKRNQIGRAGRFIDLDALNLVSRDGEGAVSCFHVEFTSENIAAEFIAISENDSVEIVHILG